MKKETIAFDDLWKCVAYVKEVRRKPYVLRLNGQMYRFAGTEEIVPYVEGTLGIAVTF